MFFFSRKAVQTSRNLIYYLWVKCLNSLTCLLFIIMRKITFYTTLREKIIPYNFYGLKTIRFYQEQKDLRTYTEKL